MTPAERAARERKQKIFVAVGGVALLLLVGLQLPGYLGGSSSTAASSTAETTTSAEPSTAPASAPAGNTAVAVVAGAEPYKLRAFGAFSRKNPFVQQVEPDSAAPSSAPPASGGGKDEPKSGGTTTKFTVGGSAPAVTIVSVNGTRQAVSPGTAFPASDPVFVLVAERPAAKSVVIGVKGGAYANGTQTTKLTVGKPLTLVNTSTGARYRIVLVAVGSGSTKPPSGGSAPSRP